MKNTITIIKEFAIKNINFIMIGVTVVAYLVLMIVGYYHHESQLVSTVVEQPKLADNITDNSNKTEEVDIYAEKRLKREKEYFENAVFTLNTSVTGGSRSTIDEVPAIEEEQPKVTIPEQNTIRTSGNQNVVEEEVEEPATNNQENPATENNTEPTTKPDTESNNQETNTESASNAAPTNP